MKIASIALAVLVAFPAIANAQNLIRDSGFESPTIPSGSFSETFTPQQPMGAWTVVGSNTMGNGVSLVNGSYEQDGIRFNAHSGHQYLDLGPGTYSGGSGGSASEQGVSQKVATSPGTSYILSFWLGSVYDTINSISNLSMVDVYINGYRSGSMIETGTPGSKKQVWHQYSITFTASTSETTLTFLNGTGFEQNDALDDVELVPAQ
jgi:hypothetical protein